jgi:hypothetical protein
MIMLLLCFGFSYAGFQLYTPKTLKQIAEVKGLQESEFPYIPSISDFQSVLVSSVDTGQSHTTSFLTQKKPESVLSFYKNYMGYQDWELTSEGNNEEFIFLKFKREKDEARIVVDNNPSSSTFVSIETKHLD